MFDPLALNDSFETLKKALTLISSPRLGLLRIVEFVEPLRAPEGRAYLAAYLPELISQMSRLVLSTDFTGTNLSVLNSLQECLAALVDSGEPTRKVAKRLLIYRQNGRRLSR
jgi:hypothetical protein